ncbi:MAG: hypothetical protein KKE57_01690, partial [Proteobacteria bacterium]|nr:hypothetical protein [Pseudomonadota bacterium]
ATDLREKALTVLHYATTGLKGDWPSLTKSVIVLRHVWKLMIDHQGDGCENVVAKNSRCSLKEN